MKPNLNFANEYYAKIPKLNREKALSLFRKMKEVKPNLMAEARIEMKDLLEGDLEIFMFNTSAFEVSEKRVIFNFLNSIRKFG